MKKNKKKNPIQKNKIFFIYDIPTNGTRCLVMEISNYIERNEILPLYKTRNVHWPFFDIDYDNSDRKDIQEWENHTEIDLEEMVFR